jgi:long-chain acyl-CoA synthetase
MEYLHTDQPCPRGEVLIRGPNVFAGYFKNTEETEKCFTDGDWLCTGDIGKWNPNGTLSIIDRRKNIFKLSQGEYVAAEKVEGVYGKSGVVGQIFVYGNSFKSMIIAVVVPNAEAVHAHAVAQGWWQGSSIPGSDGFTDAFEQLCVGEHANELKTFLFESISQQNSQLKGFEKVKAIVVEGRLNQMLMGFTEQNQCMTPTFKLRRPQLLHRYIKELKQAYADLGEAARDDESWPGEK